MSRIPALAVLPIVLALALPATAQTGPDSTTETYGDWMVRCVPPAPVASEGAPAGPTCLALQEQRDSQTNQLVMQMSLQSEGEAQRLTIIAPFGLKLDKGLVLLDGDREILRLAFLTCLPDGCVATDLMDPAKIAALTAAESLTVAMQASGGQPLQVVLSPQGLQAAVTRLARD